MGKYIERRLFHSVFVVFGITLIIFLITNVIGDPVVLLLPPDATRADYELLRRELGLDRPLHTQYFIFLGNAVRGNFGKSFLFNKPCLSLVMEYLPATLELTVASMLIAVIVAIPLGIICAVKPYSILDRFGRVFGLLGQAAPGFWLGIMAILLFGVKLKWLPISGRGSFAQLVMPALTLGFFSMAAIMRLTRSSMLDVLNKDYIRTARIKGLPGKWIVLKHAFKNALIPVVTIVSLMLGRMLGGAVVTEIVFAWPGVGRLAVQAIYLRDFPLVQAVVFFNCIFFIGINLLVDILYIWIDPRITYEKKA
jgi:ABC-type dipeptide/oligopeptide/nickel transport system permease component